MNPVYDFAGQVALVTEAGSGIGLASAQLLAEAGAAVVLADIDQGALRVAKEGLSAAGHQAIGPTVPTSSTSGWRDPAPRLRPPCLADPHFKVRPQPVPATSTR